MSHPTSDELSAFHDGELAAATLDQISAHVATCSDCRSELENFSTISDAVSDIAPVDELTAQRFIVENRRRRRDSSTKGRSSEFVKWGVTMTLAASLLIAVFTVMKGPLRSSLPSAVGTQTMGSNQAALSGGIY